MSRESQAGGIWKTIFPKRWCEQISEIRDGIFADPVGTRCRISFRNLSKVIVYWCLRSSRNKACSRLVVLGVMAARSLTMGVLCENDWDVEGHWSEGMI